MELKLFSAIKENQPDLVKSLLALIEQSPDKLTVLNHQLTESYHSIPVGYSPLMFAVSCGHMEIIELLLQAGANPNLHRPKHHSLLHYAADRGDEGLVRLLLKFKATVDSLDMDESTPLILAAFRGHASVIRLLIDAGAKVDFQNRYSWSPLTITAEHNHLEAMKVLLTAKPNLNLRTHEGTTPLYVAASNGHVEVTELLLQAQANVNSPDLRGVTPLHIASQRGRDKIVALLIAAKATVDSLDMDESTPLILAAIRGHASVIRLLIDAGANINFQNRFTWSPLFITAEHNHHEAMKVLLTAKPNLNLRTNEGTTPLYVAAFYGHVEVTELLLQAQANVNSPDLRGVTPLHIASQRGHDKIVALLIAANANIEARATMDPLTPLLVSAMFGRDEVMSLLLQAGADIYVNGARDIHNIVTPLSFVANPSPGCIDEGSDHKACLQQLLAANAGFFGEIQVMPFIPETANCIVVGLRVNGIAVSRKMPGWEQAITTPEELDKALNAGVACNPVKLLNRCNTLLKQQHSSSDIIKLMKAKFYKLTGFSKLEPAPINIPINTTQTILQSKESIALADLGIFGSIPQEIFIKQLMFLSPEEVGRNATLNSHFAKAWAYLQTKEKFWRLALINNFKLSPQMQNEPAWSVFNISFKDRYIGLCKAKKIIPKFNSFSITSLDLAYFINNPELINYLQQESTSVLESHLETVLKLGHLEVLKFIAESKELKNYLPHAINGISILHRAAMEGHLPIVKYLIEELDFKPQLLTQSGRTVLHSALYGKNVDLLRYLVGKGIDPKNYLTENRNNILFNAITLSQSLPVVQYFTDEIGLDCHYVTKSGFNLLHAAATNKKKTILRYLVENKGLNPTLVNSDGSTPLHYATETGSLEVTIYLIEQRQLDPKQRTSKGMNALNFAALEGHLEIVKYLVEQQQMSPHEFIPGHGNCLHLASVKGHLAVVKYLINEVKMDPTVLSKEDGNKTCLDIASGTKHLIDRARQAINVGLFNSEAVQLARQMGLDSIKRAEEIDQLVSFLEEKMKISHQIKISPI